MASSRSPSGWPLVLGRFGLGLLAALALLFASTVTAFADTPWSISATPTTLGAGLADNVSITVISGSPPIACVQITIPRGVQVIDAVVVSPAGWTVDLQQGNSPTVVTFCTTSGYLAPGTSAVFRVTVRPSTSAPEVWSASAYHDRGLGSPLGPPVAPLPIFNGAAPTPPPTPAPTPAPTPTAQPTPMPTSIGQPTPTSSARPTSKPSEQPVPTSSTQPSATPTASPNPSANGQPVPTSSTQPSATPTASPDLKPGGFTIPGSGGEITGAFASLGPLSWGDIFRWFVPTFAIGLPGLLLILAVVIQLFGGGIFVPIVRTALRGSGVRRKAQPMRMDGPSH